MAKGRSERRQRTPVTNTCNYSYTRLRPKTHAIPFHLLDFDPHPLQGCLIMAIKYGGYRRADRSQTPRNPQERGDEAFLHPQCRPQPKWFERMSIVLLNGLPALRLPRLIPSIWPLLAY